MTQPQTEPKNPTKPRPKPTAPRSTTKPRPCLADLTANPPDLENLTPSSHASALAEHKRTRTAFERVGHPVAMTVQAGARLTQLADGTLAMVLPLERAAAEYIARHRDLIEMAEWYRYSGSLPTRTFAGAVPQEAGPAWSTLPDAPATPDAHHIGRAIERVQERGGRVGFRIGPRGFEAVDRFGDGYELDPYQGVTASEQAADREAFRHLRRALANPTWPESDHAARGALARLSPETGARNQVLCADDRTFDRWADEIRKRQTTADAVTLGELDPKDTGAVTSFALRDMRATKVAWARATATA